jgi:hypothetical protein
MVAGSGRQVPLPIVLCPSHMLRRKWRAARRRVSKGPQVVAQVPAFSPVPSRLRTAACENSQWWHWWGPPQTLFLTPTWGRAFSQRALTAEEPGGGGVYGQAGGMEPWDLANFPSLPVHDSRTPLFTIHQFTLRRPPTNDTTPPSPFGIYCRPAIPPSPVPAPAGTWHMALSTCPPGETGWQLPDRKETIATD